MLDTITKSVINGVPTFGALMFCTAASLVFGFGTALVYMFKNRYSKNLAITLVLIPAAVQIIIMLVNGNIGTGVAVAGAFSLVRFRSMPGNAKDIVSLFFAMAVGFATGTGYLFYAFTFFVVISAASLLMTQFKFGQSGGNLRILRITIPENLNYDGLFDEVFEKYVKSAELDRVKTTNMGSMFELSYTIRLKQEAVPKSFLDDLRCRNGNLNIIVSRDQNGGEEL